MNVHINHDDNDQSNYWQVMQSFLFVLLLCNLIFANNVKIMNNQVYIITSIVICLFGFIIYIFVCVLACVMWVRVVYCCIFASISI